MPVLIKPFEQDGKTHKAAWRPVCFLEVQSFNKAITSGGGFHDDNCAGVFIKFNIYIKIQLANSDIFVM